MDQGGTQFRWQQLGELFDRACNLDATARQALIAREQLAPATEAQLRRMLDAHDRSSILDAPPVPGALQSALEVRSLKAGDVLLDRFEILRFINEGGMGEVYEALDRELRERIALKTLRLETADHPRNAERFRREVHLARRITHPNICRLFDLARRPATGSQPELLFLTMELLPGETLAERLRHRTYTPAEALPLIRQVAAGLTGAHAAGIVHRDLKPSNIMLCPDRVVVTDFGLARSLAPSDHSLSVSKSGHAVGTPAYLAPEQVEGGPVTPATDVYSFAIVIYEMITGKQPFTGETAMEVAFKRTREAPPPPRDVNPSISWGWNDVLLKALSRDPADRYRTVPAFLHALEHPPRFRVPQWWRTATQARRRRALGLAATGLLLLSGGWYAAPRLLAHRPTPEARQAYQAGLASLREGGYWRASRHLERAIAADPEYAPAQARLGDALQELDLADRARAAILRASALQQRQWMTSRLQLEIDAVRFALLRDAPRAASAFAELVTGAEDASAAWVDLGRAQEMGERAAEAEASYRQALSADPRSAAAHLRLGGLEARKQNWTAAQTHLDAARRLFEAAGEAEGVIETRQRQAELLSRQGRHLPARSELDSALAAARRLPDGAAGPAQETGLLFRISANSRARGLVEDAVRDADAGLAIARRARLESLATRGLIDLGGALLTQRKYDDALPSLERALEIATREGFPRLEAEARAALASTNVMRRDYPTAIQQAQLALQFFRDHGYRAAAQSTAVTLARAYRRQGNLLDARRVLTEQLELARRLGLDEQSAFCHQELANLAVSEGNFPEVVKQRELAIPLFRAAGRLSHAVASTIEKAAFLAEIGQLSNAEKALLEAAGLGFRWQPEHELSAAQVRATIALARQDWAGAEAIAQSQAATVADASFGLEQYRIRALLELGRWREYGTALQAYCTPARDYACAMFDSLRFRRVGKFGEAEKSAMKAVALVSNGDPYLRLMSRINLALCQKDDADSLTREILARELEELRRLWGSQHVRAMLDLPIHREAGNVLR